MQRVVNPPNNLFVNGNPAEGTPGTIVTAEWLNAVQEELANIIEMSGGELNPEDNAQIAKRVMHKDWVDVRGYNNSISAALEAIGDVDAILYVTGDVSLDTDTTIPENIGLKIGYPGTITLGNYNLTINGPLAAGPHQIFVSDGSGTVSFGGMPKVEMVYPEWWGALGDGLTDDTDAFRQAILAILGSGIEMRLLPRTYIVGDLEFAAETIDHPGFTIVGHGDNSRWADTSVTGGSILKAAEGANYIIKIGKDMLGTNYGLVRVKFKNLAFDGNENTSDGLWGYYSVFMNLEHVVFYKCKSAFIMQNCDRLRLSKVGFYRNTTAIHYEASIHGRGTTSAATLADVHHRSNDYNLRLVDDLASIQLLIRGGYWSSANIADVYVTGGAKFLLFDGANFENTTNGSIATKQAYFKVGQVSAGDHIGINYIGIINCYFQDNNPIENRPLMLSVVDSTDTQKPSIKQLDIIGNVFWAVAATITDISTSSQVANACWARNHAPNVPVPEAGTIWRVTEEKSSAANGLLSLYSPVLLYPRTTSRLLERTTAITLRDTELWGVYNNKGCVSTLVLTLPPAVPVRGWYIVNVAGPAIRIVPPPDEGFVDGSGLGKYKQLSSTIGHAALVMAVSTTKSSAWLAIPLNGATLTDEA